MVKQRIDLGSQTRGGIDCRDGWHTYLVVQQGATDPATDGSRKGQLFFNTGTNTLKIFDGSSWLPVGP